jgi:hypothetical protein
MKHLRIAAAAATVLALAASSACSGDETTASDPTTDASSSETVDGATAEPGSLPEFGEDDYTYVLEVFCYCPMTGPVKVTVAGGEVVDAVTTKNAPGSPQGSEAPEFLRKTIDDLIAIANDPEVDDVEVTWAEGADYPSKIVTDPIENAVDDEATYSIRNVQVG